jgi:hypothetical protein
VRIIIEKGQQKYKGQNNWSQQLYIIKTVIPGNKENFTIPRYKIISEDGKLQRNTFPLSKLLYIPGVERK